MSITAHSTPNIAFIKYWGNRNDELRLPMADSLSMTLDSPHIEVAIDHAPTLTVQSYEMDGSEVPMTAKNLARFEKYLALTKQYLEKLAAPGVLPDSLSITIRSAIPIGIGLASSAAAFSCLAKAIAGLIEPDAKLTDEQTSIIARFGAGSASRSVFGGFSALMNISESNDIDSAKAMQIANAQHWPLHDIVIVPSQEEKKVGSTEGHAGAHTSPLYQDRVRAIGDYRQRECVDAVLKRDFEKLQRMAEGDCLDMHRVMQTQNPPLHYLSDATHRIIKEVESFRTAQHLEVLYTMDAGPTVHLICTEAALPAIKDFAKAQKDCTIFETKAGRGAHLV